MCDPLCAPDLKHVIGIQHLVSYFSCILWFYTLVAHGSVLFSTAAHSVVDNNPVPDGCGTVSYKWTRYGYGMVPGWGEVMRYRAPYDANNCESYSKRC